MTSDADEDEPDGKCGAWNLDLLVGCVSHFGLRQGLHGQELSVQHRLSSSTMPLPDTTSSRLEVSNQEYGGFVKQDAAAVCDE